VLVPGHSAEIFQHDPTVDETIVYPRQSLRRWSDHVDFFELLQRRHYDLAVCLHASFRTALLGWMTAAPWRSVRNHSGRDWFCNLPAREKKEAKSIIQRDFDALRALGLEPKKEEEIPRLALAPQSLKVAADFFKAKRLGKKVVALLPSAGKIEKQWPRESFARLAAGIKKAGYRPLPLLAPGEEPGPLAAFSPAVFGGLQDLAAVLGRCRGAVGNDSGPRHIAAAAGTATFTLFGPEGRAEWQPYSPSQGHASAQAPSGRVGDIQVEPLLGEVKAWLQKIKS
jgi:ADP-heptose:LPS heptosyltransferase